MWGWDRGRRWGCGLGLVLVELRAWQKVTHGPGPPRAVQRLRTSGGPGPATWSAKARIARVSRATHAASVYRVLCANGEGGGGGGGGGPGGGAGGGGRSGRSVRALTIGGDGCRSRFTGKSRL